MLVFPDPAIRATFLERRNRFVAVVEVDGVRAEAHVPTTSRMRELLAPGATVWVADKRREGRVTAYDLLLAEKDGVLVSIDSRVPNRLLDVELRAGSIPEFAGWTFNRWEATLGESRLDFLLTAGDRQCWVEAKSVTLVVDGTARFPDAPTARGARHLGELARAVEAGHRGVAFFLIQRDDADDFTPNRPLDPHFADALADAAARGVEVVAYTSIVTPAGIGLGRRVRVVI